MVISEVMPGIMILLLNLLLVGVINGFIVNQVLEVKKSCNETAPEPESGCWYDGEYMKNGEYKQISGESVGVMTRSALQPEIAERMLMLESFNADKCQVIICIDRNITTLITTCPDCPPDASNTSLSFAFDSTGSMAAELNQMKTGVVEIVNFVNSHPTSNIGLYVLSTFNDPQSTLEIVTNSASDFESAVDAINIHNGNDCPEMVFGGIQKAGAVSLPNSHIYVITDASSKDGHKYAAVEAMVLHKSLHVVFILTGTCGKGVGIDPLYTKLAKVSNGLLIVVDKSDLSPVFDYIQTTFTANRVCLFNVQKLDYGTSKTLVVDATLSSFTVIVEGADSETDITLTLPNGTLTNPQDVKVFTNSLMFTVIGPMVGNWEIQVNGSGEYFEIEAKANSTFQLEYGFTLDSSNYNICETYRQPIKYLHNYLLVDVSTAGEVSSLSEAVLQYYGNDTRTDITLQLTQSGAVYRSQPFKTHDMNFDIKIIGSDSDGNPLVRTLCTIFSTSQE